MNIYFEDIFCGSCAPTNYNTPNDYIKVNLLSLREVVFNLYIIFKTELFYEIVLSIIIPNCGAVIAGGW